MTLAAARHLRRRAAGALERRNRARRARGIHPRRPLAEHAARASSRPTVTAKFLIGGIREVTASACATGDATSCRSWPTNSARWALRLSAARLPDGLGRAARMRTADGRARRDAQRAPAVRRGPLPSGRQRPAARGGRQKPARTDRRRDGRDRRREGPRGADDPRDRLARERLRTRPSTRSTRPSTTPSSARRRSACTRRCASPSRPTTRTAATGRRRRGRVSAR